MAEKDLYKILGIDKTASQDDIKKAYRKMAAKHHPDRNPGDKNAEERFKEVKKAYDILSDEQKRAAYDRYGFDAASGQGAGFGAGGAGFGGNFNDVFGDMFGDIFGARNAGSARNNNRGHDLAYELDLSLEEAVNGCDKEIRIPTQIVCDACHGAGTTEKSKKRSCPTCHGEGQVRMQQGFFSIAQTCPNCKGVGSLIENPCEKCRGEGRVRSYKTQSITIPPGVDTGDRIRFAGEGEAGRTGGQAGDLFIEIHVRKHPIFTRQGDDLRCDIPISFVTACLGGELEVPTLTGRVKLTIPPETQTGKTFRLRGKGVKSVRAHSEGDLYCTIHIETPVKLSNQQKELLQAFGATLEEGGARHQAPKEKGFFDNVKSFFDNL